MCVSVGEKEREREREGDTREILSAAHEISLKNTCYFLSLFIVTLETVQNVTKTSAKTLCLIGTKAGSSSNFITPLKLLVISI